MTAETSSPQPRLHAEINPVTPFQQNCTLIWCPETMRGALVESDSLAALTRVGTVEGFDLSPFNSFTPPLMNISLRRPAM